MKNAGSNYAKNFEQRIGKLAEALASQNITVKGDLKKPVSPQKMDSPKKSNSIENPPPATVPEVPKEKILTDDDILKIISINRTLMMRDDPLNLAEIRALSPRIKQLCDHEFINGLYASVSPPPNLDANNFYRILLYLLFNEEVSFVCNSARGGTTFWVGMDPKRKENCGVYWSTVNDERIPLKSFFNKEILMQYMDLYEEFSVKTPKNTPNDSINHTVELINKHLFSKIMSGKEITFSDINAHNQSLDFLVQVGEIESWRFYNRQYHIKLPGDERLIGLDRFNPNLPGIGKNHS